VQVTVVLLTGAAGAHAALAFPVKAAVVTGKATVASIQANLFRLEFSIASCNPPFKCDKLADINHGSPLLMQAKRFEMLKSGDQKKLGHLRRTFGQERKTEI
jgi:hypothetical protein